MLDTRYLLILYKRTRASFSFNQPTFFWTLVSEDDQFHILIFQCDAIYLVKSTISCHTKCTQHDAEYVFIVRILF